jgi:PAS domain S-box-containing protein
MIDQKRSSEEFIRESSQLSMPGDGPIRVLLVEDNRADYVYTRALLRAIDDQRYELDWETTYSAGKRELMRGVHDVYLLDYRLEDGNGLDLIREAIAAGCQRPLILLTAYGDDDIDIKAIRAGAADYMMKGEFDARLLERSIRYSLGRAQTLKALRLSQERYALAVSGANDAIFDWDLLEQRIYFSPRWHAMFGMQESSETFGTIEKWLGRVHPDDVTRLQRNALAHLKGDTPHFECELRVLHDNGTYRWVNARGLAVRDEMTGEATRMAGSVTDTTERALEHHQLRATLSSMVEGVVAVDNETRVLLVNKVAARLLGIDEERAVGRPISASSQLVEVNQMLARTIKEWRELRGETHMSPPGQAQRVIELRAAPLRAAQDDVSGAVMVLHDITDLRRFEQLQREFVGNVSHELKTPLTAIMGLTETLVDDANMPLGKQREYVSRVAAQTERLHKLVDDLLALSRAESLEPRLEDRVPVDLRALAHESAFAFEPTAEAKNISVEVELPEAEVLVEAQEELIKRVFDNLVSNAIKYTNDGGSVWLRVQSHGNQALIEVEDSGIGIAPEHQGRIFERFYRVDKGRSRLAGGTGLGLAIVKNVVLAHYGNVSVESGEGRGATFRVQLPLMI